MDRNRATLAEAAPRPAITATSLDIILRTAADRLDRMNPHARMTERLRFIEIQLSVWGYHGLYNDVQVGRDITGALIAVRDLPLDGTRAEYATRLRLAAGVVTL